MAVGLSYKRGLNNNCSDGDVNIITNAEDNVHDKCKKTETTNSQLRPHARKRVKSHLSEVAPSTGAEDERIDNKIGKTDTSASKSHFKSDERRRIMSNSSNVEPAIDADDEKIDDKNGQTENVRDHESFRKADSADKVSGQIDKQNECSVSEVDHTAGTDYVKVQVRPGQTKKDGKNRQKHKRLGVTKEKTNMAEGLSYKTGLNNNSSGGDVNIITNAEDNVLDKFKKTENLTTSSQLRLCAKKRIKSRSSEVAPSTGAEDKKIDNKRGKTENVRDGESIGKYADSADEMSCQADIQSECNISFVNHTGSTGNENVRNDGSFEKAEAADEMSGQN